MRSGSARPTTAAWAARGRGDAEPRALLLGAPIEPEQKGGRHCVALARHEHRSGPERRDRDRIHRYACLGHRCGTGGERSDEPLPRVGLRAVRGHTGATACTAGSEQPAALVDDGGAHSRHADVDAERDSHTGSKLVPSAWVWPVSAAR